MAQTKPIETPRGKLEWVVITGEGKPNMSGKLQYTANVVLQTPEETAHIEQLIEDFWQANKPEKFTKAPKSNGVYEHIEYTGEKDENDQPIKRATGKKYLAFKTGTTYNDGKPKTIKVFNSKNNEVSLGSTKIGNGSLGRICGMMGIYVNKNPKTGVVMEAGVTLYLDAIKLLKLEEFQGGPSFSSDDSEFDAVGEDFVGEEVAADAPAEGQRPRL